MKERVTCSVDPARDQRRPKNGESDPHRVNQDKMACIYTLTRATTRRRITLPTLPETSITTWVKMMRVSSKQRAEEGHLIIQGPGLARVTNESTPTTPSNLLAIAGILVTGHVV